MADEAKGKAPAGAHDAPARKEKKEAAAAPKGEGVGEKESGARSRGKPERVPKEAAGTPKPSEKKSEGPKPPRRPTLEPELARLLRIRDATDESRPRFVRTASFRYWRIGRRDSWRSPKGLQSKQRRHYGYRPVVVSVGFGSPRRTRGLTPTGFRPVIVRTPNELGALDRTTDAAVIARTVGVRRRLVLEEAARKLGLKVLNPISPGSREA